MAKKKIMTFEARKISEEKWGLYLKGTDVCYGVSVGECSQSNAELSAKRINRNILDEIEDAKQEKK